MQLVAASDDLYGEVPKAIISLNKGYSLTEKDVKDMVAGKLAKFKVPQYVQFVDDLPHTNNGKISKKMIKKLYSNA